MLIAGTGVDLVKTRSQMTMYWPEGSFSKLSQSSKSQW